MTLGTRRTARLPLKPVIGDLGQESRYSAEKARRLLGWAPRPVRESILDCANSILDRHNG